MSYNNIPLKQSSPILNNVENRFLPLSKEVLNCVKPEAKIEDFTIIEQIGKGSFGKVYKVQHNTTKEIFAIKEIDKRNKHSQEGMPYFRREIEIMYKVHHQHVVRLVDHFEDSDKCYFVMEYFPNGNLRTYLKEANGFDNKTIAIMIKELISAVYYLHNMTPPIIHRDIKSENILLDEKMRLKLTDFGWSNYINGEFRESICGTPAYFAPEMIKGSGHDEKLDIWCIGVLLFELLTRNEPFQGDNNEMLKRNIVNMKITWPKDINIDGKDLIMKILKSESKERISLSDMLKHRFFTKHLNNIGECLVKPGNNHNESRHIEASVPIPMSFEPQYKGKDYTRKNSNEMPSNTLNYKELYEKILLEKDHLQLTYNNLVTNHHKTTQDLANMQKAKDNLLDELSTQHSEILEYKTQLIDLKQSLLSKDNEISSLNNQLENYIKWRKNDQEEIMRLTNITHQCDTSIISYENAEESKIKKEYDDYKTRMTTKIEQINKYYETTVKSLREELLEKSKLLNEKEEEIQKGWLKNNEIEVKKYDEMVNMFQVMIGKYEMTLNEKEKELETLALQMKNIKAMRQLNHS